MPYSQVVRAGDGFDDVMLHISTYTPDKRSIIDTFIADEKEGPEIEQFVSKIRESPAYVPTLSPVVFRDQTPVGFAITSEAGIRTANEIIPVLTVRPLLAARIPDRASVYDSMIEYIVQGSAGTGYCGIITTDNGEVFRRSGFLPAREEYGFETHFPLVDEEFLAYELGEDKLYRRSGFLILPDPFNDLGD